MSYSLCYILRDITENYIQEKLYVSCFLNDVCNVKVNKKDKKII